VHEESYHDRPVIGTVLTVSKVTLRIRNARPGAAREDGNLRPSKVLHFQKDVVEVGGGHSHCPNRRVVGAYGGTPTVVWATLSRAR
jgi:hypothetical protein